MDAARGVSGVGPLNLNTVWVGDSITAGNHLGSPTTERFSRLCCNSLAALGHTVVENNIAIPSDFLAGTTQGATADGLYDSGKDKNILILMDGINDLASGTSGATNAANTKTFCLARRATGFKIVVCTVLPINDAPTLARTKTNNSTILADSSFWDAVADVGAGSSHVMGQDSAPLDGSLYIFDHVHPTALGNIDLEPDITAAIVRVLTGVGGVSRSRMQLGM